MQLLSKWMASSLTTRLAVGLLFAVFANQPSYSKTQTVKILVMGDSISAEYGLKRGTGWVALLESRMAESVNWNEKPKAGSKNAQNATKLIAPQAINTPSTGQKRINSARWFDMDDAALQKAVAAEPRLVHFVAQTADIQAAKSALKLQGIDRGTAVEASRHTRKGRLEWKITVRDDGQRLFNGTLPSLIQWGKNADADPLRLHPRNTLPRSGVSLQSVAVTSSSADKLQAAYTAIGLSGVTIAQGEPNLTVTLRTPKGVVTLQSMGI